MTKLRKRDRVKIKITGSFDKVKDFSEPMIVGTILAVALFTSCEAKADEVCFIDNLSTYQQNIAYQAYRAGEPHDLGLITVAVAYKESRLGLYKVRFNRDSLKDQSYGVMHTAVYWKTKGMTPFEAGRYVERLLESDEKSIDEGVKDLLYWQTRAKGNWFKGVAMYNAGGIPDNGVNYAKEISNIVRSLKHCKF